MNFRRFAAAGCPLCWSLNEIFREWVARRWWNLDVPSTWSSQHVDAVGSSDSTPTFKCLRWWNPISKVVSQSWWKAPTPRSGLSSLVWRMKVGSGMVEHGTHRFSIANLQSGLKWWNFCLLKRGLGAFFWRTVSCDGCPACFLCRRSISIQDR